MADLLGELAAAAKPKSWWETAITAALPTLITAGGGYLANQGSAASADRIADRQNMFTAEQNQLQRDARMQELQMSLAAQAAQGGADTGPQYAAIKQRAYQAAIEAMLAGARNSHSAAELMVNGMQAPHRGR